MSKAIAEALAQRALLRAGAANTTGLVSFDDNTREARLVSYLYPNARDRLLSDHAWRFATRRSTLVNKERFGSGKGYLGVGGKRYPFCHALPRDCLRVLAVVPSEPTDPAPRPTPNLTAGAQAIWAVRNNRLLSHLGKPSVTFLARVPEDSFPTHFASALVDALAADLAFPLSGLARIEGEQRKRARSSLSQALSTDETSSNHASSAESDPLPERVLELGRLIPLILDDVWNTHSPSSIPKNALESDAKKPPGSQATPYFSAQEWLDAAHIAFSEPRKESLLGTQK